MILNETTNEHTNSLREIITYCLTQQVTIEIASGLKETETPSANLV